jgi:hypothetical protein
MGRPTLIIVLMIGAGLLGGITNYFRIEQEKKNWFSFLKNVLLGVCVSKQRGQRGQTYTIDKSDGI